VDIHDRVFDLRSDTVSQPTPEMRAAMAAAPLGGDDCYGDDPGVVELETRVATLLGKEAALFCPSGTMSNQLAVHTHCTPGESAIVPALSHLELHEEGSAAALSGVTVSPLGREGRPHYEADELARRIREEEHGGWPRVGLVWVENTLGLAGGRIWPQPSIVAIGHQAREHGRPLHIDGARLWNAHVATGLSLAELATPATSVSLSLSKGLGCPAGSLLCGPEEFVSRARHHRHAFGGAMRQTGILAAAGLWALDQNLERIAEDHTRARRLASELDQLDIWTALVPQTNILLFEPKNPEQAAEELCSRLRAAGILCHPNRFHQVRLVVHLGIDDAAVEEIVRRATRELSDT
jgi:threonine aldolase